MTYPFRIGVIVDSFRLPPREGMRRAAELGADGFQMYAVSGEVCPENLGPADRRNLRGYYEGLGLTLSALCGDLGGHGFGRAEENAGKIGRSKKIVDLAVDLGTTVVTTHIGVVPSDKTHPRFHTMRRACRELGDYAASRGVTFAVETGPETAAVLRTFLDTVGSKGIGVNFDPANFVMVTGDDPVKAVVTLAPYIVHTHAKDGVQLKPCDPQKVYDAFAGDGVEGLNLSELFNEVPLGEGKVDFDRYLVALHSVGYQGFLTIEREVGNDPASDIGRAVRFLRDKIGVPS